MSNLREEDDVLILKISGDSFETDLKKAREIQGRRYNPDNKTWEFPGDADTLMKIAFTVEPELTATLRDRLKKAKVEISEELITKLPDDANLTIPWSKRLVPRQRAGVDFLAEHPHSLLCDDIGSGKTVQAISAVYEHYLRESRPPDEALRVLIVCPNSVTGHWKAELEKWSGDSSTIVTGDAATRKQLITDSKNWTIINYEALRLHPELSKVKWDAVIADEIHRCKNRKSQMTKALWKLRAPVQLGLSATPIMNDPGELWAPLKWLRKEQYKSYWAFLANYAETYSGFRGKQVIVGVKNPDALRFELADKLVRRTRREIHADIPEPFPPAHHEIPMKPKQEAIYDSALKDFWLELAHEVNTETEHGDGRTLGPIDKGELARAVEKADLEIIKLMIPNAAARLTRLRQIATSPALLGGPDESGKLDAVIDTITDAEEGRPFVLFCWYKATVALLIERLAAKGIDARGFTGDTKPEDREALAQAFQNGDYPIIVPTLATGGVGIDLYRSSDPLLVEQDWVPAINEQAIGRCDRKGQTASVQAQIFRSSDTVETGRLAPKLATKSMIVTAILGN